MRRANQKFDMPKEIGHDESMKLSLSAEGDSEDGDLERRATGPETRTASTHPSHPPSRTRGRHGSRVSSPRSSSTFRAQCCPTSVPSLYLDPQIRDWVLFPITLVMVRASSLSLYSHSNAGLSQILVGVLRHYVVVLLQSSPKRLPRAAIREQCVTK